MTNVENTFYIIGTVAGPHPYPTMVRDFQSVIGNECLVQMPELIGRQPDAVIACVGGGSNAMGIFYPYIEHANDAADRRRGGGRGTGDRPARGVDQRRQPRRPARQPHLPAAGRATARSSRRTRSPPASTIPASAPSTPTSRTSAAPNTSRVTDDEALAAFHRLCLTEGIIPALESSHAVAYAIKLAPTLASRPATCSSTSRGAATRTSRPSPRSTRGGRSDEPHRRRVRGACRARQARP